MNTILQNAVYSESNDTYYRSCSQWDRVSFKVGEGWGYIDGGHEYIRSKYPEDAGIVDWSLWEGSPREEIVKKMLWGTRGKSGIEPLKWLPLCSLTSEHLNNILTTQSHIGNFMKELIREILDGRNDKD